MTTRNTKVSSGLFWLTLVAANVNAQIGPADASRIKQDHLRRLEQSSPTAPRPEVPALRPASPQAPASGATVTLTEIQFSPTTLLSVDELARVSASYIGRTLTSTDLQALLDSISSLYQQKGILTAVPILPQQNLRSGTLRVLLVEGRLGQVRVDSNLADSDWVKRWFSLSEGEVVTQDVLSQSLNLFNASSDYKAAAEFVAGDQFGISDLNVSIADVNPVQYWTFAEVNRHNTTPSNLVAFGIKLSPASSRGGQFEAATLRTSQSETLLANTSWPLGVSGWRAGAHASVTQTRTRFESDDGADGITIKGKATSLGLEVSHRWALSESTTFKTHATWGRNDFGSSLGSEKLTGRQMDKLSVGGTLEHFTTATQSWLKLSSAFTKEQQGSAKYTEYAGVTLIHLDQNRQWSVKFSGYGRLSHRGKDFDAEPFAIGGQDSVRGYTSASVASRQGHALQTELRFRPAMGVALPMELMVFSDSGKVRSEEEARRIRSAGIGVQARLTHQMSFDLLYTRQLKLQEPLPNRWMARLAAYW